MKTQTVFPYLLPSVTLQPGVMPTESGSGTLLWFLHKWLHLHLFVCLWYLIIWRTNRCVCQTTYSI